MQEEEEPPQTPPRGGRQHQSEVSTSASSRGSRVGRDALLDENERLRRELEELRQLKASVEQPPKAAVATQSPRLQRRGYGPRFSIRSWMGERNEQLAFGGSESSSSGASGPGVLESASAAGSSAASSSSILVATEAAPGLKEATARRRTEAQDWLGPRPYFSTSSTKALADGVNGGGWRWDTSCDVQRMILEAGSSLAAGGDEGAAYLSLCQAFAAHLRRQDRVHLGFSATMPPFFALLRSGANSGAALTSCAALFRRLKAAARFGDKPPTTRPDGMTRWDFVRELCAQAGLSLDLARLAYAQRRDQRRRRTEVGTTAESSELLIGSDELQSVLARAGRHLRAAQIDIERLRDEAEILGNQQEVMHRVPLPMVSASAPSGRSLPEGGGGAQSVEAVGDALFGSEALPLPIADDAAEDLEEQPELPKATTLAAEDGLLIGINYEGVVDELLIPNFGQFLDKQLLPLYVGDIPFAVLRDLLEHYCGLPMDSGDEQQAWKVLGRSPPVQKALKSSRQRAPGGAGGDASVQASELQLRLSFAPHALQSGLLPEVERPANGPSSALHLQWAWQQPRSLSRARVFAVYMSSEHLLSVRF
ncbi:unnamed protein product [Polarella glacialis]|uniref:Uncharacterized protein n=1 Tax=Polarella glacialis TaxID=89957 RepID=A0A813LUM9_POLGL|nr:unnamed protein product [Polarella glacialis]